MSGILDYQSFLKPGSFKITSFKTLSASLNSKFIFLLFCFVHLLIVFETGSYFVMKPADLELTAILPFNTSCN